MCASKVFSAVALVQLFAVVLHVIGLTTPYWVRESDIKHNGLFTHCVLQRCYNIELNNSLAWFRAVVGLEIFAMIFQVFAALTLVAFHYKNQSRDHAKVAIFFLAIAGFCGLVGIIVFGCKEEAEYLNWSYALTTAGSGLAVLNVAMVAWLARSQTGYMSL